jgi:hypothetical protein
MQDKSRRSFLRGLTQLPLIGGGVSLIGNPVRADVPITKDLLDSYDAWLDAERRWLQWERYRNLDHYNATAIHPFIDRLNGGNYDYVPLANGGTRFHGLDRAPASTRAAIVLSAIGCDWMESR